jgi:tetratricopeptide (TPR) repeat protein
MLGPTPVPEAIRQCEEILEEVSQDKQAEALVMALLGSLCAMDGRFERARELVARAQVTFEDLGLREAFGAIRLEGWRIEMLAGSPDAAERHLREAYDLLTELGERYFRPTVAGLLAQTLYVLERYDEIESLGVTTRELAGEDDVDTQALWRCVQAKALARRGSFDEAHALATEALEVLAPTDAVLFKYGALLDLAEVLRLAGRSGVEATLGEARHLADAKDSPVLAGTVEALLAAAAGESLVP